MGSSGHIK
ncbi:hypothetical protein D039_3320, partial [Vibrio parahaemolyticus EKP-028]